MEKPKMPAPRAENMARSRSTFLLSSTRKGRRFSPMKSETIWYSARCCMEAVSPSRKILDGFCPVVPEEARVLNTSSGGTLRSSSSLNRDTGSMGASSGSSSHPAAVPSASSSSRYSGHRSRWRLVRAASSLRYSARFSSLGRE